jgi:hypothetical protein
VLDARRNAEAVTGCDPPSVSRVLWGGGIGAGPARPHLLRISGARKSVVAVTGGGNTHAAAKLMRVIVIGLGIAIQHDCRLGNYISGQYGRRNHASSMVRSANKRSETLNQNPSQFIWLFAAPASLAA